MGINDILNMSYAEFNSLNAKQLKQATNILASAANKRLDRAERAGRSTPATRGAMKSGGRFSTAGKNLNQTRAEFTRAKSFLQEKTSTYSGYREEVREAKRAFEERTGVRNMTDAEIRRYYDAIDKFREQYPDKVFRYSESMLAEFIKGGGDAEEAILMMQEQMQENYESMMDEYAEKEDAYDISDFFDLF